MNISESTYPEQMLLNLAEESRSELLKTDIALKHMELTELINLKLLRNNCHMVDIHSLPII